MSNQLDSILTELYALDPALAKHEPQLRLLITELLATRPAVPLDEHFVERLKTKLLAQMAPEPLKAPARASSVASGVTSATSGLTPSESLITSIINFINHMRKFAIAAGIAILILVIIIPLYFSKNQLGQVTTTSRLSLANPIAGSRLGAHAFGGLSVPNDAAGSARDSSAMVAIQPSSVTKSIPAQPVALGRGTLAEMSNGYIPQSGLQGSAPATSGETNPASKPETNPASKPETNASGSSGSATPISAMAIGIGGGARDSMFIRPPQAIKYVYKGDPLTLADKNVDVLRRVKPGANAALANQIFKNWRAPGVDLGTFNSAGITNITLLQEADKGYSINLDVAEGIVSIDQNWSRWYALPMKNGQQQPLTASDVPPQQNLITLADQFIADHHVDLSSYGPPQVEDGWQGQVMPMSYPSYISDTVTVLYPLKINNSVVYEFDGRKNGLRVAIDIRSKRVVNLGPVTNQTYDTSAYESETDFQRLVSAAEGGGDKSYYPTYSGDAGNTVNVNLGTPERVFAKIWKSDGLIQQELLVPALAFPVMNPPLRNYGTPTVIIVPLVKELMQNGLVYPGVINMMGKPGATVRAKSTPAVMKKSSLKS